MCFVKRRDLLGVVSRLDNFRMFSSSRLCSLKYDADNFHFLGRPPFEPILITSSQLQRFPLDGLSIYESLVTDYDTNISEDDFGPITSGPYKVWLFQQLAAHRGVDVDCCRELLQVMKQNFTAEAREVLLKRHWTVSLDHQKDNECEAVLLKKMKLIADNASVFKVFRKASLEVSSSEVLRLAKRQRLTLNLLQEADFSGRYPEFVHRAKQLCPICNP